MGSWNNSWVKNLPVRPLAPRRKTPGQLYPMKKTVPRVRPTKQKLESIKSGTSEKPKYLKPWKPTNDKIKNLGHIRP